VRLHAAAGEGPQAPGLVSVSTTHTRVDEALSGGVALDVITIDKALARFTRLQKNVGVAAKLHQMSTVGRRVNLVMVTLTYRPGVEWQPTHVRDYLTRVRNWFSRLSGRRLQYVWVAEVQDGSRRADGQGRGVIHYHLIFWLPKGVFMPKADRRGWWPHGMTKTEVAQKPVAYVMSYAKKLKSKEGLPHGARIYGVGGLDAAARGVRRWLNWPAFVQARAAVTDSYAPQVGGGWVNRVTGEWWPAEFGLSFSTPLHTVCVRLHDHGRPIQSVVGPYSWAPGVKHG
jgi:hypothetical protein